MVCGRNALQTARERMSTICQKNAQEKNEERRRGDSGNKRNRGDGGKRGRTMGRKLAPHHKYRGTLHPNCRKRHGPSPCNPWAKSQRSNTWGSTMPVKTHPTNAMWIRQPNGGNDLPATWRPSKTRPPTTSGSPRWPYTCHKGRTCRGQSTAAMPLVRGWERTTLSWSAPKSGIHPTLMGHARCKRRGALPPATCRALAHLMIRTKVLNLLGQVASVRRLRHMKGARNV